MNIKGVAVILASTNVKACYANVYEFNNLVLLLYIKKNLEDI